MCLLCTCRRSECGGVGCGVGWVVEVGWGEEWRHVRQVSVFIWVQQG